MLFVCISEFDLQFLIGGNSICDSILVEIPVYKKYNSSFCSVLINLLLVELEVVMVYDTEYQELIMDRDPLSTLDNTANL